MYSWERRSGSSWTPINNANRQSYTTNSNMAVGQYTYRCVVRNEAGSVASDGATVNVYGEYCSVMKYLVHTVHLHKKLKQ